MDRSSADIPILEFCNVSKSYDTQGETPRVVLSDLSISVRSGQTVAIVGRSGSGKSTFLHLAAAIDVPTAGSVRLAGLDLGSLSEHDRTLMRRDTVGLIFQFFHLLPHLSVRQNISLPDWIAGPTADLESRVDQLLDRVGLLDRAEDSVQKLSGGEMQRVALCRSLLRRPRLLLADEPTGNLDDENGRAVMDLLLELCSEQGSALIYVTHDAELAALADEVWHLHAGTLDRR